MKFKKVMMLGVFTIMFFTGVTSTTTLAAGTGVKNFTETMEMIQISKLIIPKPEIVEEVVEESNLIIADVTNYVNIRSLPGEDGEILGKLYDNSVGTKVGEENGWYYITSGKVTGYVKAEYVLTGEEAKVRAEEVGTRLAEVTTTTLKVRQEPSTESIVLGLVPGGDILSVLEETEGWVKVSVEEGEGYVSTDYMNIYTENVEAESKEEEEARLLKEEEERRQAEEAARAAIEAQKKAEEAARKQAEAEAQKRNAAAQNSGTTASGSNKKGSSSTSTQSGSGNTASSGNASSGSSSSGSQNSATESTTAPETSNTDLGQQIVDYALKFVGNPYVYGGTSLTNGTDCSGFVMSVYAHYGISLPRTSGEQGKAGRAVDGIENAQAGDLIWYSGHIGIYMGNGQVVHASNAKDGIKISTATYRTILGIRRIV